MEILLLTSIAGTNFSHRPGDVVDWPDAAEAKRLIASDAARAPTPGELLVSKERNEAKAKAAEDLADADKKTAKDLANAKKKKRTAEAKKTAKNQNPPPKPQKEKKPAKAETDDQSDDPETPEK